MAAAVAVRRSASSFNLGYFREMNPILVVDADDSYCELVLLTLQNHCGVDEGHGFTGGPALLRHLSEGEGVSPALVLLDFHMPRATGVELMGKIRALAPQVPIAFLSGAAGERARNGCLAAGAFAFLCKPVAYAELIHCLQELFGSVHRAAGR